MRAAILVPSVAVPAATDAASAIIGTLLEDALASDTAGRRLVPLPSGGVTAAVARAVEIDANENSDGILMLIASSHRLLDSTGAEALGFDRALLEAARVAEDEIESRMSEGYAAMSAGDVRRAEACYLAADRQLGNDASPRRALVLVSLGDIARIEGRVEEAIAW